MNISPVYKSYIVRSLGGVKPIIIVSILAVFFVGLLNGRFGFNISLVLGGVIFLVVMIVSLIENAILLRSFEINEETNTIILTLMKFNHHYKTLKFDIDEVKIEIQERGIVYESYFLKIMIKNNDSQVLRQSSVGGWNTKLFVDIIKKVDEIKGTTTDVSYVKGAFKYN